MSKKTPRKRKPDVGIFVQAARLLFIGLALAVLGLNTVKLKAKIQEEQLKRKKQPYVFTGILFAGLKDVLQREQQIGYYTDKDLDNNADALQFTQAQYTLAPIILDLNNIHHAYILFDCSSPALAAAKVKELGVVPIRKNQYGIILARNPNIRLEMQ